MRLEDRVAIVTGSGNGIGEAIAQVFAAEGAAVVLAARTVANLESVANEIKSKGGKVLAVPTDITDDKQIQHLIETVLKEYGKIDILINNCAAPGGGGTSIAEANIDVWKQIFNTNLIGTMLITRAVLKNMIARRTGSIVNLGSIAQEGHPTLGAYSTSKAGLIGFTKTLAIEVGKYNIRVNALTPAATATDRFEGVIKTTASRLGLTPEEVLSKMLRHYSLGRMAKPSEIGTAALFLASDDASAVTGQNLVVSCGFHLLQPNEIFASD